MNLLIFNLKTDVDDAVLGFTTDWINAIAAHCNQVVVITMCAGRISVADNVEVFSIGKEKGYSEPRRLLKFYEILWSVLNTYKIDACFAHMIQLFAILSWPLLKPRKIPIVLWYEHSHIPFSLKVATALVDRVVGANPNGFGIKTHKFCNIGHGIDVQRFKPVNSTENKQEKDKVKLLTLGRISPVKRLETAIEAIALLPESVKQKIELQFVGDPLDQQGEAYAAQLRKTVATLALEDSVFFQSGLPFHQAQQAYQSADIFINSSNTDSIDKAGLEAMSCELPVITSNRSFIKVFGKDLAKEWCIPKNDPETLARRIEDLSNMPIEERKKIGKQLREIVCRSHSLTSLSNQLINDVIAKNL